MADPGRIDGLIAAVPQAMALRAGLELGLFTRLGGGAMSAGDLGAALGVDPGQFEPQAVTYGVRAHAWDAMDPALTKFERMPG